MDLKVLLVDQNIFGFIPSHSYNLYFALATIVLWLLFYLLAWKRGIRIIYNSSLKASWLEEIVFRGLVLGMSLYITQDKLISLVISAGLFGIVHMRNMWWAGFWHSTKMSIYNALVTGVVFGIIRLLTGDIYLGILVHFLHNLRVILKRPAGTEHNKHVPTDLYLKEISSSRK